MPFLIYGAYGYTGRLITEAAVARGLTPTLAGRDGPRVRGLAEKLVLPYRIFDLEDTQGLDAALRDVQVVVHCAGPFVHTARPMVEGCLRTDTDYLDITGEVAVFEALAARDEEARAADVMLLPGAGFDVVPSDGVAAQLHQRLPAAEQLALAMYMQGGVSRGTALTAIEQLGDSGMIRRDGRLQSVPWGWRSRTVDFGAGPTTVTSVPMGDVVTAYRSTGIPNITTYLRLPKGLQPLMKLIRWARPLATRGPVRTLLRTQIRRRMKGPTAEERAGGTSFVWGEAIGPQGERAVLRLRGPEAYTFTERAVLQAVTNVLDGQRAAGFQTPSTAFGAHFVRQIEGVTCEEGLA